MSIRFIKKKINEKKYKVCLEYHIGNCKGPCVDKQKENDYLEYIKKITSILNGKVNEIIEYYKTKMLLASNNLDFEKAQIFKEKLVLVENYTSKSIIVNPKLNNINIFTLIEDENWYFINYMCVERGSIVKTKTLEIKKELNERPSQILQIIAFDILKESTMKNSIILSNYIFKLNKNESIIPKKGDKLKLIQLSQNNAKEIKINKTNVVSTKGISYLKALKKDLMLKSTPKVIECFDNSNFQGSNPVASMVHFKNGLPLKKEYRHFNIKTVIGPNDFASMDEIVFRRYSRIIAEQKNLPNLIVIDGGKGQLTSATNALKRLNIYGKVPIIGIAKRLEEIYFPNDSTPIHIIKTSISLKLLQKIRDEAHRFAIKHHRNLRSKNALFSKLISIKGIGSNTQELINKTFKTEKALHNCAEEDLAQIIGKSKAKIIKNFYRN